MKQKYSFILLIQGLLLLAVMLFSLCIGPSGIPLTKTLHLLLHPEASGESSILFQIRLPRTFLAASVGGALSLSGLILQGLLRNPLVEPYTLGISGGAALMVCLSISFGLSKCFALSLPLSGFLGASLMILLLYNLSFKKGILKVQGLLLTGVMFSFISSSLIMLIMALAKAEDLNGMIFWIMGSMDEPDTRLIKIMGGTSLAGLVLSLFFSIDLNALLLGEEEARNLGIRVERSKKALFLLASLLTGTAVSVSGVIGFVGLLVPQLMRLLLGHDYRILLLSSFFSGAAFLVISDAIARTIISPLELPVGVITGILGGMVFIYVLNRNEKER